MNKDHWEILEELSNELNEASTALYRFKDSLDELPYRRKEVIQSLASSQLLINKVRDSLSIMDIEWSRYLEELDAKSTNEDDYDSMEF